jgi:choline kinase
MFDTCEPPRVAEVHNDPWDRINMVSSLCYAAAWLREEPCAVSYSDVFYELATPQLLQASDADIAITYAPQWQALYSSRFADPLTDTETFKMDTDGFLTEIGRKPTTIDEVHGQYMGLLRFSPPGWTQGENLRRSLDL